MININENELVNFFDILDYFCIAHNLYRYMTRDQIIYLIKKYYSIEK